MPLALPRDAPTWACLGLAVVAALLGMSPAVRRSCLARPRRVVLGLGVLAALLSWGYLAFYLRGGPRIIDATSYFLEARSMARGFLAFPVVDPASSFRGRFLVSTPTAGALAVIFPPGYPALLALGFLVGAPLAVGPLLATLLVVATYALALRLFGREDVALFAALLSTMCAALRYHTADTMSHGLAALLTDIGALVDARAGSISRRFRLVWQAFVGWLVRDAPGHGIGRTRSLRLARRTRDRPSQARVVRAGPRAGCRALSCVSVCRDGILLWLGAAPLLRAGRRSSGVLPVRFWKRHWVPARAR